MERPYSRWSSIILASILAFSSNAMAQPPKAQPGREAIEFFESKIRPVLVKQCYECHSTKASKVRGGLYLDTRSGVTIGGDNGPAIVPGDPAKSLLIKALRHEDLKMPPKEKLPTQVLADFEQWVRMGAPDPRTTDAAGWKKLTLDDAKTFWSFKPMQKFPVPPVKNPAWARSEVDRFIQTKLEAKGLKPVIDADRASLVRRVTFDLIGLPPTPEEMDAFVNDKSANAFEKVVDRLLASKHFGERWGRHWLDVARYAESNGNADNILFPHAWRYRDYVIKSFNEDKPYNRFITEQIAGDLLPAKTDAEKDDNLVATGFLALTSKPRAQNNPDYRMDLIADQLDVTCRAIMSMTIVCARCHDHKFDPIPTKDYYSLAGIFDSTDMLSGGQGQGNAKRIIPSGLHSLSTGGVAMGVKEGRPKDTAICIRGDTTKPGDVVPRGYLTVGLTPNTQPVNKARSGRLELAGWITQPDHPLTSRVMVNRIWLHLFGQGLSRVPDNFGLHGEPPTHPELLDTLALKFMEDGWSVKKMIRQLVLTRTYQLNSAHDATNYQADPDNNLWWRIPARRLEAEAIRDAMLAVSGKLNATPPNGSLAPNIQPKGKREVIAPESPHRSVYLGIIRNGLPESLAIFDVADPSLIVGQREVTTVPAQALFLMNSPFVLDQAKGFADRLLAAKTLDEAGRIDLAFRLALARTATPQERERVLLFLQNVQGSQNQAAAWTAFCQNLLASAEFRYLQ
jgi:hypothetical protein